MIDPVLAGYRATYASEERRLYCDFGPEETKRYLLGATAETPTARAIPRHWCVALFLKGYALNDRRDFAGALPYLQQAVGMAPAHAHFLNELGYTLGQLGRTEEALDAFNKAEAGAAAIAGPETRVERGRALRGIGAALVELSRWDEAEAAYRRGLALDPSDTRSRAELGWIAENRPKSI
ncbi:tetratricopeptide repeat protein [Sphingomonas aracearum]|nr:tetratricopeptide repeat protein [Sphingomonas aracearum]